MGDVEVSTNYLLAHNSFIPRCLRIWILFFRARIHIASVVCSLRCVYFLSNPVSLFESCVVAQHFRHHIPGLPKGFYILSFQSLCKLN